MENMANTLTFLAEKNVSSFCIAKTTQIFAAKVSMYSPTCMKQASKG